MVTKTTSQIQVSVHTQYDAKNSFPINLRHGFRYYVIIKNTSGLSVQLLSRTWNIVDIGFAKTVVEGDGVIGMQPILEPGEVFKYFSNVILQSGIGNMTGHYIFQNVETKENFNVDIPKFDLVSPILDN